MKRITILIILFCALGGGFYAYKMYNKKHIDVQETKASLRISAQALFEEFEQNNDKAREAYEDQVIEVEGSIYTLDLSNSAEPQVVLEANGIDGYVRCGFKQTELDRVKQLSDTSTIILKGECKGYNGSEELDLLADKEVVLSNCIIIE